MRRVPGATPALRFPGEKRDSWGLNRTGSKISPRRGGNHAPVKFIHLFRRAKNLNSRPIEQRRSACATRKPRAPQKLASRSQCSRSAGFSKSAAMGRAKSRARQPRRSAGAASAAGTLTNPPDSLRFRTAAVRLLTARRLGRGAVSCCVDSCPGHGGNGGREICTAV